MCCRGDPVDVTVDTYPDAYWHGNVVDQPGDRLGVFGAAVENASGNWVKITQRVTVTIKLDSSKPGDPPLRAGMSTDVTIDTGHRRWYRLLFDGQ